MSIYSRTVGWWNMSKSDMGYALVNNMDQNLAAGDLGVFNWQWNLRARRVGLASHEILQDALEAGIGSKHSPIYSALNQMLKFMVPKLQDKQFEKALHYAQYDDKMIGILGTMVDFGMSGFTVASDDGDKKKKISEFNRQHHVHNVLLTMWGIAAACDNVAVMLSKKNKSLTVLPLPLLRVIPTHQRNSDGRAQFRAFLKLPKEMVEFIRKNLARFGEKATKGPDAPLKNIPEKWIKTAQHPNFRPANDPIYPPGGFVELLEKDDEFVYIMNSSGLEDRLINPTMASVFPSIELRALLQDGEFSVAYLMKYFIHQIKIGPTAEGRNLQQILRQGRVTKEDRKEVSDRYRIKVDKALFEVTDQFLTHIFHFPGNDVEFGPRFATADQRIEWWARISRQIVVGEKGNYSGGLIYLKGYSRKISRFRDLFGQFLEDLYDLLLKDTEAEVQWDEHYMKEPRQRLREVTLLVQHGMDMETVCKILGYNWKQWVTEREKTIPSEILSKKGKDDDHLYQQELQTPFFEPNQGLLAEGPGGRPATTDDQTDDQMTETSPRPEIVAVDGQDRA